MKYDEAAEAYLRSLPPEHFMEATSQGRQREITVESLALLQRARPEVQYFNELLVQYPLKRGGGIGQVVPDNMVVICPEPIKASGSFNLPLQPVRPFWVLEYVSKSNKRKDYEENMQKYERDLKVPYFLLFFPDGPDLTLYRHTGRKYVTVKPNGSERYPIKQLELEVGLLDGWVRYWFRGELLLLPADLQGALIEAQRRAEAESRRAEAEARRGDELERRLAEALRQLEEARKGRRG
jgi:Uma2 family endonuclease